MRNLHFASNVTVFLAFFGIALLEAVSSGRWSAALFWLLIGAFFLRADQTRSGPH